MKSKGKKKEELDDLKKDLTEAKNLFVAQFQGMTVAQDTELRMKIRESKSKYRVVKNTLVKKAAEGTSIAAMPSKEELMAKLLFLINSPAQRLAVALNGVARNLAVVLKQAVEQKKFHE